MSGSEARDALRFMRFEQDVFSFFLFDGLPVDSAGELRRGAGVESGIPVDR